MAYSTAQMSYLVDLGMRPDADDAAAETFVRTLAPQEEATFTRIAIESEATEVVERNEVADSTATESQVAESIERTDEQPTDVAEIVRQELAREATARRSRQEYILSQAGDDVPRDLIARAQAEDWSTDRVDREFLRAVRSRPAAVGAGPAVHSRSHETNCTLEALQGAVLLREGFELDDQIFRSREARHVLGREDVRAGWLHNINSGTADASRFERARDNAHRYASRSLVDICREALRISGRQVPDDQDDMIRRALTTNTVTSIFSTSINMQILAGYMGIEDTTGGWTRTTELSDFKAVERARLTKASGLAKIARGGVPQPIEYGDAIESYKLARYAGKFEVSEEDIIDDRFGGLSDHTPREMGELAAELRPNLVFGILLANKVMRDNTALFHATHGNLLSSALDVAGLDAAKVAMATQTENGRSIRNSMRFLIVPEKLDFVARQLMNSAELRGQTAGTQAGIANPLQNRFTIITDPRLDVGVTDPETGTFHAGSATKWFGASAENSMSIEVGYRTGTGRAPRMTSYMLPGDRKGMGWRIDLDIAAKAIDWRSLLMSVPG